MKRRTGFVSKCLIGAVLTAAASSGALVQTAAADDAMPVKASPLVQTDAVPYWWFHGEVEAGGRVFLNNPQNGFQTATGRTTGCGTSLTAACPGTAGRSLAKYYEYSDIRPGPFGNIWLSTGSKDGLYQIDIGGKNIGYEDQQYYLDASKAGQFYFNFGWDQTPHLYSTSALTPWAVNGNVLTLPGVPTPMTAPTAAKLAPYAQPTDIGIQRDTASFQYRWTPDDAWDIKADYSHLSRTGTQVGMNRNETTPSVTQFPMPVDDTTQNYGLSGEYLGTSPWGQKLIVKGAYTGSTYTDNYASIFLTNPATGLLGSQISTPPSNQANGGSATIAADLPWKSRYVGTVNYTSMTQNAAFIPSDIGLSTATLPAQSLNGTIDTTLFNNVITTKINPELTNKLTYRYYNFDNQTPSLYIPSLTFGFGQGNTNTITPGYIKQNAGEELTWRPTKEWNLGVAYGFERYDWSFADVDATNENSGKIFADWKPHSWLTVRASAYYGNRRYENYNYMGFVGAYQWPALDNHNYASSYRQLMYDNRETWKGNFAVDLVAMHNLTLTPTVKYESVDYGLDVNTQQGLKNSTKWAAGIDATYIVNPDMSLMVGYMYEYSTQLLFGCNNTPGGYASCVYTTANPMVLTNDQSTVHTFTTALRYAVIPQKFDTELRYTASHGADNMLMFIGGKAPAATAGGQFTEDKTWFQRLDATATYKFDKEQVAALGWKGDVKAKLHYTWERSAVDNFENDGLLPYTPWWPAVSGNNNPSAVPWLAWNNPNYNVHMLAVSLIASW
jgi:MtrB/PioB family decaheme-associated outer membrane protein